MIQNNKKSRGRPRTFDEGEALQRAIKIFWAKGYDGVVVDDLVEGMGVGRPSLYAVFGDKQSLFMKCVKKYAEDRGASARNCLLGPSDVREGVRSFICFAVQTATEPSSPSGCLIACVAPVVDDRAVREFLVREMAEKLALIEGRLRRAIETRELPKGFPVALRARQILDITRGLSLRARLNAPRDELMRDARLACDLVMPPKRVSVGHQTGG